MKKLFLLTLPLIFVACIENDIEPYSYARGLLGTWERVSEKSVRGGELNSDYIRFRKNSTPEKYFIHSRDKDEPNLGTWEAVISEKGIIKLGGLMYYSYKIEADILTLTFIEDLSDNTSPFDKDGAVHVFKRIPDFEN